jgi:hypothetical protein
LFFNDRHLAAEAEEHRPSDDEDIMVARIYRPAKTAMQSGQARTKEWLLEYEPSAPRQVEPLMGWTSSTDMNSQVRLEFDSKEEAISYAERNGIASREPLNNSVRSRCEMEMAEFQEQQRKRGGPHGAMRRRRSSAISTASLWDATLFRPGRRWIARPMQPHRPSRSA